MKFIGIAMHCALESYGMLCKLLMVLQLFYKLCDLQLWSFRPALRMEVSKHHDTELRTCSIQAGELKLIATHKWKKR
eukprot:1911869-Amphidinium_carterae.1